MMTTATYSIAEARNQFTTLIRRAEQEQELMQVTRRGHPVAVILSMNEYNRLADHQPQTDFWQSYMEWRDKWQVDDWEDEFDPFADIRDQSPGREVNVWL